MGTTHQVTDGVLQLAGPLTLDTAGGCYRQLTPLWAGGAGPNAIDLAGAGRIDSAGLALLLEWQALAQRQGRRLEFRSASTALVRLARLCGAAELLGLEAAGGADTRP